MLGHRNHLRFKRGKKDSFEKRDDRGSAWSPGITGAGCGKGSGAQAQPQKYCIIRQHQEASGVKLQTAAPNLGMSGQRPQRSSDLVPTPPFPDFVLWSASCRQGPAWAWGQRQPGPATERQPSGHVKKAV